MTHFSFFQLTFRISRSQVNIHEQLVRVAAKVNGNRPLQDQHRVRVAPIVRVHGRDGLQVLPDAALEQRRGVAVHAGGIAVDAAQARQLTAYAGVLDHTTNGVCVCVVLCCDYCLE